VADVESFRRTRPQRSLRWEAGNLRVRLSDALGADFAALCGRTAKGPPASFYVDLVVQIKRLVPTGDVSKGRRLCENSRLFAGRRNFEAYRFSDEEKVVPFPVVDGSTDAPPEFSHGLGGLRAYEGSVGKGPSTRQSRRSIACTP
jgi:hypothetical protein